MNWLKFWAKKSSVDKCAANFHFKIKTALQFRCNLASPIYFWIGLEFFDFDFSEK